MQIKVISMMGKLYEWHVKVGHVESTFHSPILDNLSKGTPATSSLFHSLPLVVGDMANHEIIAHVRLLLCGIVMRGFVKNRPEHNHKKSGFDELWESEMDGVPKKVREYLEKWHERAHTRGTNSDIESVMMDMIQTSWAVGKCHVIFLSVYWHKGVMKLQWKNEWYLLFMIQLLCTGSSIHIAVKSYCSFQTLCVRWLVCVSGVIWFSMSVVLYAQAWNLHDKSLLNYGP